MSKSTRNTGKLWSKSEEKEIKSLAKKILQQE
jgi:hypothetical protein